MITSGRKVPPHIRSRILKYSNQNMHVQSIYATYAKRFAKLMSGNEVKWKYLQILKKCVPDVFGKIKVTQKIS